MQILNENEIRKISPIESPPEDLSLIIKTFYSMVDLCVQKFGVGLSATQVGFPWTLFIACNNVENYNKIHHDLFDCFYDCTYTPIQDNKVDSIEGCLTLPGRFFNVSRYDKVRVIGKRVLPERDVVEYDEVVEGLTSTIFQHEIDHTKGILISDIGKEVFVYRK